MDENDETVSNKSKFSFSIPVVKTPKKKKKKESSKSLQAQQEMSKLKDQHFQSVQNLSSEFEMVENVPILASQDKEENNLPLRPVLGFCAKCGNNFNKVALLMLHKKGLYGKCLKVKRKKHEAQELDIDLIQFKRFTIAEGSNLVFKMNSSENEDEFFMCVNQNKPVFNQNKPVLVQERMDVRLGNYLVFFTLCMLCLGAAHLSKLCFSVF